MNKKEKDATVKGNEDARKALGEAIDMLTQARNQYGAMTAMIQNEGALDVVNPEKLTIERATISEEKLAELQANADEQVEAARQLIADL